MLLITHEKIYIINKLIQGVSKSNPLKGRIKYNKKFCGLHIEEWLCEPQFIAESSQNVKILTWLK